MVKFLIIRLSSIGDIVLTTPVIRCLKTQLKEAEIHYLTKEQYTGILSSNPYVDRIWSYKNNMKELLLTLKAEKFDYIIDLHHNIRTFRIKNNLKVLSFSFDKLNFKKWLLVNFRINKLPNIHIVDRYLETLKLFDVTNDGNGLDYFFSGVSIEKKESLLSVLPDHYVALVIGAQHETKKAPPWKLAEICDKLDAPVLILGGKTDIVLAEKIMESVRLNRNVFNITGKFSLDESAIIVKNAEIVITHDTGLMHIAAAFKKKIISIWGNTIPEFGMYPYLPHPDSKIAEVNGLNCRPCSKIGHQTCPKKHFRCMVNQNSDEIVEWAKAMLNTK